MDEDLGVPAQQRTVRRKPIPGNTWRDAVAWHWILSHVPKDLPIFASASFRSAHPDPISIADLRDWLRGQGADRPSKKRRQ
jgi:hypothetical protein